MAKAPASSQEERALTAVAIFAGAAAIITYPAALAAGPALGLSFTIPLSLAAIGRLRQQRSVELGGGLGTIALLVIGIAVGLGQLVALVLIVAPAAVLLLVAGYLLQVDVAAGRAWRLGASLGLLIGHGSTFILGQPQLGAALALPFLALGAVVAQIRLTRRTPKGGARPGRGGRSGRRRR